MSEESLPQNEQNNELETEENNQQPARSLGLDLGDDCVYNIESNRLGSQAQPGTSATPEGATSNPKREDNPFSFKHFLRDSSNSNRNYNLLGARPKVYRENRHNNESSPESPHRTSHTSHNTRLVNEFSSALPDFVQDHLVVEQCFLGNKASSSQQYDLDLPDFTQSDSRPLNGPTVSRSSSMDEPSNGPIPLDLPGLSLSNAFPLDLPVSASTPLGETVRTTPLAEVVGNSKSLPDFLTDGPVRSSGDGLLMSPPTSAGGDLRSDAVRCHRCTELRIELANARQRASRAEDEADKNSRKATVAENTVMKLKQELKVLKSQFRQLQSENQALRASMGAATLEAGVHEMPAPRLAQELRAAASTAEHSLRSLLTGVDNLRMMASALENMSRIEEKTDRFSNFDDGSGPAL